MFSDASVSHSVQGEGGSAYGWSACGESAYRGLCIHGESARSPMLAATAAVGTHPTGMHSCFI